MSQSIAHHLLTTTGKTPRDKRGDEPDHAEDGTDGDSLEPHAVLHAGLSKFLR